MAKYQGWAGWPFRGLEEDLSILDVVKFGTIDYKLAGLFWLLMEQRASIVVAAGPAWVGKTTLMHAMLDFLPPQVDQYTLKGYFEDFREVNVQKPEKTYLVAEEISNHQSEYLWGVQVVKAFNYLTKGFALGTTTHARNIQEVAYILNALGVKPEIIARLGLIVTMQVARGKSFDDEPIRFVDTVSTINNSEQGLVAHILASRGKASEAMTYPDEDNLKQVLGDKFGLRYDSVTAEIEKRGRLLQKLDENKVSRKELLKAIGDFYREKSD
mgnify:CR=1 FL=1